MSFQTALFFLSNLEKKKGPEREREKKSFVNLFLLLFFFAGLSTTKKKKNKEKIKKRTNVLEGIRFRCERGATSGRGPELQSSAVVKNNVIPNKKKLGKIL